MKRQDSCGERGAGGATLRLHPVHFKLPGMRNKQSATTFTPIFHFSNLGPADLRGVPARPLLAEVQRAGGILGTHDGAGSGVAEVSTG